MKLSSWFSFLFCVATLLSCVEEVICGWQPYPPGYISVRPLDNKNSRQCSTFGWKKCIVFCVGKANSISEAKIFKKSNGSLTEVKGIRISYPTTYRVWFFVDLNTRGDVTGAYVCRITSNDGKTAETTITITVSN